MTNEQADLALGDDLVKVVSRLPIDSAEGRAGMRALLHEIEARHPGILEQMASGLQLRRLRLRSAEGTA